MQDSDGGGETPAGASTPPHPDEGVWQVFIGGCITRAGPWLIVLSCPVVVIITHEIT